MADDDQPQGDQPADETDPEEEASWSRLSPRLRSLISEELDAAEQRRAAAAAAKAEEDAKTKPEEKPAPASTTKETPSDERPRRRFSWF